MESISRFFLKDFIKFILNNEYSLYFCITLLTATLFGIRGSFFFRKSKDRAPPCNPDSMFTTLKIFTGSKSPEYVMKCFATIGSVFFIDIKASRLLLEGDIKRNVRQAEKIDIYKAIDSKPFPSIFSKKTYGDGWDIHRKSIAPSFSLTNIRKTFPKLESCLDEFCQALDKNQLLHPMGFDMLGIISRLMLDAITISMFDVKFHSLSKGSEGEHFLHEIDIWFAEFFLQRFVNPFRKLMFWDGAKMKRAEQAARHIEIVCEKILDKYRSTYTAEEIEKDTSILGHLVRCPYENDEHRCYDMFIFLFAGHDTSSITITWTLIEVVRHPHVLEKLRQELDSIHPDKTTPFTFNELSQLNYLQMVINESMRLCPVGASGQSRIAEEDIEVDGGYVIKKGSDCTIYFLSLFRQGIKNGDSFIPERFESGSEDEEMLKQIFFPFGLGKRNCIGMNLAQLQIKLILATLFQRYNFDIKSSKDIIDTHYALTYAPKNVMFSAQRRA